MGEALKQRLIGALVLLALASILWPVVFDAGPTVNMSTRSEIPPAPEVMRIPINTVTVENPAPAAEFGEEENPPAQQELAGDDEEHTDAPQVDVTDAERGVAESSEPAASEQASSSDGGSDAPADTQTAEDVDKHGIPVAWSVQVASFSRAENAAALVERLKKSGYKAYAKERQSTIRVLVGPKLRKESAESLKRELDELLELETLVIRFAPV